MDLSNIQQWKSSSVFTGLSYKVRSQGFFIQNNPKNLEPSFKTDLEFLEYFRREDKVSKQNFIKLI